MEKKRIALLEPDNGKRRPKLTEAQKSQVILEFLLQCEKISSEDLRHLGHLRVQQADENTARDVSEFLKPFLQSKEMAKLIKLGLTNYIMSETAKMTLSVKR